LAGVQRWALLNERGRRRWGKTFPFGSVPILCTPTQKITFRANFDPESVIKVNWSSLSIGQQQAALVRLSRWSKKSEDAVLADILRVGLHIGRGLIDYCGIEKRKYFAV
jgi:hypothetical protein